jgi:hypothetical protein
LQKLFEHILHVATNLAALAVCQVGSRKAILRVRGLRISKQVQFKDFGGSFEVARALVILSNDADRNFRPQLRLGIFRAGLGAAAGRTDLIADATVSAGA